MKPDIIILSSQVSYRNKLKEYLTLNGIDNVSIGDSLTSVCTDCKVCTGRIVIASGKEIRYSDLISATRVGDGSGVCPRARFILTYDGSFSIGDCGLAKCARCVRGGDGFEHILELVREETELCFGMVQKVRGTESAVRDILDGLGFNPSHKGYGYILFAVQMSGVEMITKDVYPDIAKKNKTTAEAVERSIRSAVSAAWSHGGFGRFNRYIGWESTKCPTNSELLESISAKTKIGIGKAEISQYY